MERVWILTALAEFESGGDSPLPLRALLRVNRTSPVARTAHMPRSSCDAPETALNLSGNPWGQGGRKPDPNT